MSVCEIVRILVEEKCGCMCIQVCQLVGICFYLIRFVHILRLCMRVHVPT